MHVNSASHPSVRVRPFRVVGPDWLCTRSVLLPPASFSPRPFDARECRRAAATRLGTHTTTVTHRAVRNTRPPALPSLEDTLQIAAGTLAHFTGAVPPVQPSAPPRLQLLCYLTDRDESGDSERSSTSHPIAVLFSQGGVLPIKSRVRSIIRASRTAD